MSGFELRWPGKFDARGGRAQIPRAGADFVDVERHPGDGVGGELVLGDNLVALDALVRARAGEVDLVYIDPPFATGGKFSVSMRVGVGENGRPPPEVDSPAYSDRFEGGVGGFLAMLDPRLRLIRELLAPHGSLYIHVDPTVGHAVKLLADEIFGADAFQREIVWRIGWVSGFKTRARNWIRNHDLIFFYTKDPHRFTFNKQLVPYPEGYTRRDGSPPKGEGMPIEDVWNASETEWSLRGTDSLDSIQIKSFSTEKSGYATQKNLSVLRRIIAASSNEGDLVADLFCGSGTTMVAAAELGRRFIGCDCGPAAIHIARKRLLDLQPRPELVVRSIEVPDASDVHGGEDAPAVALALDAQGYLQITAFAFAHPQRLDPEFAKAAKSFADFVDGWWIGPEADAPSFTHGSFRTHNRREISLRLGPLEPGRYRVRIVDVLSRPTDVSIEIDGGELKSTQIR